MRKAADALPLRGCAGAEKGRNGVVTETGPSGRRAGDETVKRGGPGLTGKQRCSREGRATGAAEGEERMEEMVRKVLARTAEILEAGDWTQYAEARRGNGVKCGALDSDACAWCLTGALHRTARDV